MSGKNEKKLTKLNERITEIDNEVKKLNAEKKELGKQISELLELEKYDYVKSQNVSLEQLTNDLEIGKMLRENGISKDDIAELIGDAIVNNKKEDIQNV